MCVHLGKPNNDRNLSSVLCTSLSLFSGAVAADGRIERGDMLLEVSQLAELNSTCSSSTRWRVHLLHGAYTWCGFQHAIFTLWCCTGTMPVSFHTSTQDPGGHYYSGRNSYSSLEWKHTISWHASNGGDERHFVAMWTLSRCL